jgi:hypothetical protein
MLSFPDTACTEAYLSVILTVYADQTYYQSGQSDLNQAAAHIWQAGASRPDLIDCQGVEGVIFDCQE